MSVEDIGAALQGWEFKLGMVQARQIQTQEGKPVIQMRVDLGVLQLELVGRPDGLRPHNHPTYLDYLKQQARQAKALGKSLVLDDDQCEEADREFLQYYHRRVSCLALRYYSLVVADADHTLAFMDFLHDHSPDEDFLHAHERFRGFVLFHRTQAASDLALEKDDPEGAIDEIRIGLEKLRAFYVQFEQEELMEEDQMVQQLRETADKLRQLHSIDTTLREQLDQAVANEAYEEAAKLRDALRKRE